MQDKIFDHIIKSKLKDLSSESNKASWSNFIAIHGSGLEAEAVDLIDELIKAKIDAPVDTKLDTGWNAFASKFEDELAQNDQFDKSVKENLSDLRTTYNPSHWEQMKERLENIVYIKEKLYTTKAFELIIASLLLISFANYLPLFTEQDNIPQTRWKTEVGLIAKAESIEDLKEQFEVNNEIATAKLGIAEANDLISRSSQSLNQRSTRSENQITIATKERSVQPLVPIKTEFKLVDSEISESLSKELVELDNPIQKNGIGAEVKSKWAFDRLNNSIALLGYKNDHFVEVAPSIQIVDETRVNNSGLWLHLVHSINRNSIRSTIGTPIGAEDYRTVAKGSGWGAAIGIEHKRWGISLGFAGSSYTYSPDQNLERYLDLIAVDTIAEFEISLEGVKHQTINIPLNLDYAINNPNSSWKFTGSLGLNLNIINTIEYDIRNEMIEAFPIPGGVPVSPTRPINFDNKEYINGYSDGGAFSETASLYLSAGFGIQKSFANYFALYVNPRYQTPIINSVIKPNGDRISRLSFDFGLKYRLVGY